MYIARTGLAVAAALLILSSCASAEDVAAPDHEDSGSSTTEEPSEDPSETPEKEKKPTTPVPEVGDCRKLGGDVVSSGYTDAASSPLACSKSHNTQTVFVTTAKGKTKKALKRGDSNGVYEAMLPVCQKQLSAWSGASKSRLERTGLDVVVGAPPAVDVKRGATWLRCDLALFHPDGHSVQIPADTKDIAASDTSDADWCVRGEFSARGTTYILCDRPHDYRIAGVVELGNPSGNYPGEKSINNTLRQRCVPIVNRYLGGSRRYGWQYPLRNQWKTSDGLGRCYAKTSK